MSVKPESTRAMFTNRSRICPTLAADDVELDPQSENRQGHEWLIIGPKMSSGWGGSSVIFAIAGAVAFAPGGLLADVFGSGSNAFTVDFVAVGDAGNPADSGTTGSSFSPYGAVSYDFRMGTTEISRESVTKANVGGNLGISLTSVPFFQRGNAGPDPAMGVSWNEAARFVNYLNTSTGATAAYKFALQPGDTGYSATADIELWNSNDVGFDPTNAFRNLNATYFLPSENEWYKAAYYGGTGSTYFDYAGSDVVPTSVQSGTADGTAVYDLSFQVGPAPVAQSGGTSYYGARGMNGNIGEYTESAFDGSNDNASELRAVRDSYFNAQSAAEFSSSFRNQLGADSENINTGFRVASVVPEPAASALIVLGLGGLVLLGCCRHGAKRSR